jgi:site-specific DNA recombinase
MTQPPAKILRCAIYTRVSTDYGLEQEFNSLDAQREAAEAYVKSQAHEGWRLLRDHYDDGGFSGGSMERPALQQLLAAIRDRKVDIVVVYKVDRLTRSLADFAKLVELFDANGVSFVSVTQAFNTTNSMGRLTLNVLLSFAQFEREVTGERIRDKVAASKRKGMRMGGPTPLGYDVENKKLVANPEEAERVRLIFRRYLELGCLTKTVRDLRQHNIISKRNRRKDGSIRGGVAFGKGALHYLLRNRVYVGEIVHKGSYFPGEHEPIVQRELFEAVQQALGDQELARKAARLTSAYLLTGRIFDDRGNRMSPSTVHKGNGVRYRYYVSRALTEGRKEEAGSVRRVPAADIEVLVAAALRQNRGDGDAEMSGDKITDCQILQRRAEKVVVHSGHFDVFTRERDELPAVQITVPWLPDPTTRKREIILAAGQDHENPIRSETRARLLEGIAKGRQWLHELVSGAMPSTLAIAARERCSDRSVRMHLSLAFLQPSTVMAAVEGRLPRSVGISSLVDSPAPWQKQTQTLP